MLLRRCAKMHSLILCKCIEKKRLTLIVIKEVACDVIYNETRLWMTKTSQRIMPNAKWMQYLLHSAREHVSILAYMMRDEEGEVEEEGD